MYTCKLCGDPRGPGLPMLRHTTYRTDRSVLTETPVCELCWRMHGPGEMPERGYGRREPVLTMSRDEPVRTSGRGRRGS